MSFNPFVNPNRPLVLSGNHELRSQGIKALEALTDEALVKLYPDYSESEIGIAEIELWENMPIRCLIVTDGQDWITWTGVKWIREEQ
jgi:hypothetical protein